MQLERQRQLPPEGQAHLNYPQHQVIRPSLDTDPGVMYIYHHKESKEMLGRKSCIGARLTN